ncbi:hypothetical protein FRC09_011168 [Ceratobasidium sp. 395]|nr:hypothetical protein FRC09_011168 [Ceratobasidium sp. 395]
MICTGNPDSISLSDAIKHEASDGHILARRQLDRIPERVELNPLSGEESVNYIPNLAFTASSLPRTTVQQNFPFQHTEIASASTENIASGSSDWHSAFESWSRTADAHFTVPGPALPTDPLDTVYDLFGAAAEEPDEESSDSDFESEPLGLLDLNLLSGALPSPPRSPPPDELTFNPWQDNNSLSEPIPHYIELPDYSQEWWPFASRQEALFCLMTAFPRAVFSGRELDVVRWFSAKCNVPGMPTESTIQTRFEHIIKLLGLESQLVQSELGNYFAVTSLESLIRNEMANPIVRKELSFYPQDSGSSMSCAAHGKRWSEEVDASLAAPMVRKLLPFGQYQDYFVHEPLLASVSVSDDEYALVPQAFLPVRFFERSGEMFARCHPLTPEGLGYTVDSDIHTELSITAFLLPLTELRLRHGEYGLPSPDQILGVRSRTHPDSIQPWAEPVENPWRQKANGKRVHSVPVWLYCDDTSGNASKKWNKHNSFLFTLAGLSRAHAQLPYNVQFLATSNIATPLEMLEAITKELVNVRKHGVVAYDCQMGEDVLFIPWVYAMQGDNPMQSELCSHIGLNGKFFCRVCHVRGKDQDRKVQEQSEVERISEFMQTHEPRKRAETLASLREQEALGVQGSFTAVDTTARKVGVKDKYLLSFVDIMKEYRDKQKKITSRREGNDLVSTIRRTMPDQLLNPALFIPDLDPNQDTPVEILHVILLGVVKYFWRDAVSRQKGDGKEVLKARINSLDVSGLGLAQLRGATLVQYAGSLTGRDFRAIVQIGPLVLHGLVPECVYEAWLALAHVAPLVFQQDIEDIDDYTHIRRFGPAVLFATETFESYNFVIRLQSIHSNRHAPSHDIGRAFSRLQSVRHLVSGGWITQKPDSMTRQIVREEPRQAGKAILDLQNDKEFMLLMGMGTLGADSHYGDYMRQMPLVEQTWSDTLASQHTENYQPPSTSANFVPCDHVVLKNHDYARRTGFVLVQHHGTSRIAQVAEILVLGKQVHGVTVQFADLLAPVPTYRMPGLRMSNEFSYLPLAERQDTGLLGDEITHQGDLLDLVLNTAAMRSASLIQQFCSTPVASGSIADIADRAVAKQEAIAAQEAAEDQRKKDEKDQKAEEKARKTEEKKRRAAERAARMQEAEQAAPGRGGKSGRRRKHKIGETSTGNVSTQAHQNV